MQPDRSVQLQQEAAERDFFFASIHQSIRGNRFLETLIRAAGVEFV